MIYTDEFVNFLFQTVSIVLWVSSYCESVLRPYKLNIQKKKKKKKETSIIMVITKNIQHPGMIACPPTVFLHVVRVSVGTFPAAFSERALLCCLGLS